MKNKYCLRYFLLTPALIAGGFIFDASAAGTIPTKEECVDYLYSTMILPDSADYSREFFSRNVEASLQARRELPWGDSVPEREWRHFVLPVRVNNEDLDSARWVFYKELKPRVEHLSMKDAILEVNHWCHEKVTYQPSDARTSSPLSAVSQAIGRCGEESTFTVAALRSVGIPARQVYTPRWAHTDDNHAWVEAWADGRWWFFGACEPEPMLNLAWFNAPASRGMLMHTVVSGPYDGPEEVISRDSKGVEINVTSNYAKTAPVTVKVVDKAGKPVSDAYVNFSIYNYAEYYPAIRRKSDADGMASTIAGLGDMIVWASDERNFGLAKVNSEMKQPITVTLDKDATFAGSMDFDIVPPQPSGEIPTPSAAQVAENDRRKAQEDSIRTAYTATFLDAEEAARVADTLTSASRDALIKILTESRGNHKRIVSLLNAMPEAERERAIRVLSLVSEKDRRDLDPEVVTDALEVASDDEYVLNPRIEREPLRPFREEFLKNLPAGLSQRNPSALEAWTAANIELDTYNNPKRIRMSPLGVFRARKADRKARSTFFVAAARALEIPARIDPVTAKTQYRDAAGRWIDVKFGETADAAAAPAAQGKLSFDFKPQGRISDPGYYTQFSISRIENGLPYLLEFDEEGTMKGLEEADHGFDAGQYALTTGQRMADGSVLARTVFFQVEPDKTATVPLEIRQNGQGVRIIGGFNAETLYDDLASGQRKSVISTTGRGFYSLALLSAGHEPTQHVINDLAALSGELEADGRKIMLIFRQGSTPEGVKRALNAGLPKNAVIGIDSDGSLQRALEEGMEAKVKDYPAVIVADTFNRVVLYSEGYTIGIGNTLLDTLTRVE